MIADGGLDCEAFVVAREAIEGPSANLAPWREDSISSLLQNCAKQLQIAKASISTGSQWYRVNIHQTLLTLLSTSVRAVNPCFKTIPQSSNCAKAVV